MIPFALLWWTTFPVKIRKSNFLLSEVWFDGSYLMAWPKFAGMLPLAIFFVGLVEGATHWSALVVFGSRVVTPSHHYVAVDFAQMVPLLFVAAIVGAFSAQLGLLLTVGFACGDLLLSSHPFPLPYHASQFVSYLAFLLLAVSPSLTAKVMTVSLPASLRRSRYLNIILGLLIACLAEGYAVRCWTFAVPMLIRVQWHWAGVTPPIAVTEYTKALNPALPLAATVAIALRIALSQFVVRAHEVKSVADARQAMAMLDMEKRSHSGQSVAKVFFSAFFATALICGLLDSPLRAAFVFAILFGLFVIRELVLPKLPLWSSWVALIAIVPLVLRAGLAVFLSFGLTRLILLAPRLSARANGVPGAFGVEIACFLLSLAIAMVLIPPTSQSSDRPIPQNESVGIKAVVLLSFALAATGSAQAQEICLDPVCCFGGNSALAALVVAALLVEALPLILLLAELTEGGLLAEVLWTSIMDIVPASADSTLLDIVAEQALTEEEASTLAAEGDWNLGSFKSASKWANQMAERGWTPEQISEALTDGEAFPAPNNVNPGSPATRYVSPSTGRYVVIDEITREILQLGGDGFRSIRLF